MCPWKVKDVNIINIRLSRQARMTLTVKFRIGWLRAKDCAHEIRARVITSI